MSDEDIDDCVMEEEGPNRRKHRRKQLTYQRLVHSIDSALDENNYDLSAAPKSKVTIKGLLPDETDRKKKVEMKFVNQKPTVVGRQKANDIMRQKPGLSKYSKNISTPKESFSLFITDSMLSSIVEFTNKKIVQTIEKVRNVLENSDKYPHVKVTKKMEIEAFVGLLYYRGLYCLKNHSLNIMFSDRFGLPVFSACMSRMRFEFLMAHLCFDNFEDRAERWQSDRFAAIRDLFEDCNKNFGKSLIPEDYLSLDETLYPMRTQIAFKQYNPDKPAKYGLLFKSINCARYPYTYQSHVYCGKPQGDPNEHYVSGTFNYIVQLVNKLGNHHNLDGRNISMDRLYTSFKIANWLLDKKITMVGTFQANRVGIPPDLKKVDDRDLLSNKVFWQDNGKTNISSYVVKTSKGKKNVLMLSTIEPIIGTTIDDEKKKPALYKLYDFTKGGTDIVDQKIGSYTVKSKSRKQCQF